MLTTSVFHGLATDFGFCACVLLVTRHSMLTRLAQKFDSCHQRGIMIVGIMIVNAEFSCQQSHEIGSWSEHVLILSSLFGNSPFLESAAPASSSTRRTPCKVARACSLFFFPDVLIHSMQERSSSALAKPMSCFRVSMNVRHLLPQEALP